MATPFPEVMRGIMSGVGYGRALLGGAEFEPGPAGTTIANLKEPMPGGDLQALGNVILANPGLDPRVREQLIREHELGHVLQSEVAGPFLPLIQAGAGAVQMLRGKDFYYDNPIETSAPYLSKLKMMMEGEPMEERKTKAASIKGYQGGTMPRMQSIARYGGGQASAKQSPFVTPPIGPTGGFGYIQSLLERQMQLKEQMMRAQLRQMEQQRAAAKQQMREAKRRASRQSRIWGRQNQQGVLSGGRFHPESGMGSFVKGMIPAGMVDPAQRERLYNMLRAIGIPAAYQGAMQSGRIMGQLGAEALRTAQPHPSLFPVQPLNPSGQMFAGGGFMGPPVPSPAPPMLPPQPPLSSLAGAKLQGRTAEKGGRVPKTGTYKLHKGEVVLNKQQSDMMFPTLPEAPKKQKSFQEGIPAYALSPMLDEDYGEQIRASGLGQQIGYGLGLMPPAPPPSTSVLSPAESMAFDGDLPPAPMAPTTPPEPEGVKKYTLIGKPETEPERVQRLRESADRKKEDARIQRARARLLLTYVNERGEVDPLAKKHIQERQWVAKQFEQDAAVDLKEAEELEAKRKETETAKEVASIQQRGRVEYAEGQARQGRMEEVRKMFQTTRDNLNDFYNKFLQEDISGEAFIGGAKQELVPYMGYLERTLTAEGLLNPGETIEAIIDDALMKVEQTGSIEPLKAIYIALDIASGKG